MKAEGVLAVGETMVMVTPTLPTELVAATDFRLDIGGAESNVASHLVRLGATASWAGAVGDDSLGRRLLATLNARGVDTSRAIVDPGAPTGVYFKDPGNAASPVLYYRTGSAASRLGPDYADRLPLDTAPFVHVSGITAALSESCLDLLGAIIAVRSRLGLPISFDVNFRSQLWNAATAAPVLADLARRCDLVFVGRDEAHALWGTETVEDVRDLLGDVRTVVKDGAVGAHHFERGNECFVSAEKVQVIEPIGAGDAFAAGFLAGELADLPPAAALELAHRSATAALSTTTDF